MELYERIQDYVEKKIIDLDKLKKLREIVKSELFKEGPNLK